ncbi:5514_t:CDS:2, partial [Gigaspora rosea]
RTLINLTDNEKIMVLSVHRYLQKNMPKLKSKETTNLRKEVSLATGVGEATVARIVADFNRTGKIVSSKQGQRAPKEFQEIKSDMVVSCWKKCLDKARNYWETIDDEINDESDNSDNESLDFCSGDEDFCDFCSENENFDDRL